MGPRVRDAEANRHFVEERRVGKRDAARAKIVADVEHDLVTARPEGRAGEQRPIAAPVIWPAWMQI